MCVCVCVRVHSVCVVNECGDVYMKSYLITRPVYCGLDTT